MQQDSPAAVFARAQAALQNEDWEAFFACIAPVDLKRLARLGFASSSADAAGFADEHAALCLEYGVSSAALRALHALDAEIRASALAITQAFHAPTGRESSKHSSAFGRGIAAAPSVAGEPRFSVDASNKHRALVAAHTAAVDDALAAVSDLAAFTAATERLKRATLGGGSVNARLFLDEALVDVAVKGRTARATRHRAVGSDEPIHFVKAGARWFIKIGGSGERNW